MSLVLVAEDDGRARESLRELLTDEGYDVRTAADGGAAAQMVREQSFDAVLVDIRMPGRDGLQLTRDAVSLPRAPAVLVMTAYGSSSVAIEAMKAGAYDYLTKPLRFDELLIQLERAIGSRTQARELLSFQNAASDPGDAMLVGESAPMQQVYKLIGQVAPTEATVLIRGESGTGKELVARAIHRHSRRAGAAFVAVNCAAIPEALLESELFGYEKGAFTGATTRRRGRLELAQHGTVFLDEIGELPASTQSKLLRVLQERTIEPLGGESTIRLDVRIVAATNRDLESMVEKHEFREDLYYRLNVVHFRVPSLRERVSDVPALAEHVLARVARREGYTTIGLSPDALRALMQRSWPGNVRELEHTLERAAVLSRGGVISAEHVEMPRGGGNGGWCAGAPLEQGFHALVEELERSLISRALQQNGGNRTRAAEALGIHRRLLYEKLRQFGIES